MRRAPVWTMLLLAAVMTAAAYNWLAAWDVP
jgi:hypothetical protein